MTRAIWFALVVSVAACAGRAPATVDLVKPPAPVEAASVAEARVQFPRTIDMHQRIVSRSCAPNAGVCHNTSNYPDLSTTGSLLQAVSAWCNLAMPDPTQGFDLCERKGDLMAIANTMVTEIASVQRDSLDHWTLHLRDPAPHDVAAAPVAFFQDFPSAPVFQPAADWQVVVDMAAGGVVAHVSVNGVADNAFIESFIDEVLASLVPGDPNGNGVFGADAHTDVDDARVIAPGSLARSYLWGRITGTVPGSRMPLANQPLTDSEYVAIACFIETLQENGGAGAPEDAIDYDGCAFAKAPVSYAVPE